MGDEDTTPDVEAEEQEEQPEKTFSQKDISRIGAREKAEGSRAGLRRALEAAGVESLEELTALRDAAAKAKTANLDENQRIKQELDAEKASIAAERLAAKQDRYSAKLERKLILEGIDPDAVAKVSKLVDSDVDSSDEDIETAIADLKESFPQLFGPGESGTPDKTGTPPTSDPGKSPNGTSRTSSPSDRAAARLQSRHGAKLAQKTNP